MPASGGFEAEVNGLGFAPPIYYEAASGFDPMLGKPPAPVALAEGWFPKRFVEDGFG